MNNRKKKILTGSEIFDIIHYMRKNELNMSRAKIAEFCRRNHIRKLSLFGSIIRNDLQPDSDVDVLVVFEPGQVVGFKIIDMEEELSRIFGGHRVDIVNEKYLNPRLRERILANAEVQYAKR
jgi:predicted nucleotidyltransferase